MGVREKEEKKREIFGYLTEERDSSYRFQVNFQRDKFNRVRGILSFFFLSLKIDETKSGIVKLSFQVDILYIHMVINRRMESRSEGPARAST